MAAAAAAPSGIKVIIVGAGFAGLACAIECRRKGQDPIILEKFSQLKPLGAFYVHYLSRYGQVLILVAGDVRGSANPASPYSNFTANSRLFPLVTMLAALSTDGVCTRSNTRTLRELSIL